MVMGLLALLAGCGGGGGGDSTPAPAPSADTTPNGFVFAAQTGTAPSAMVASNEVVISGITGNAAVTITGGEYSINGGAFTTAAGTVANGQRLQVRVTGSSQFSTAASAVVTVGGVSATFTATTAAADPVPDAFQFTRAINAARDAVITSGAVTISGTNTSAPVTIVNGEYSIAGGAFTSAAGTIQPGQTIAVRARAGSTYSKNTSARLTIGTVAADFEVTSELPNYLPDGVAYDGQDIVYLLSNANLMIFRWSVAEGRYLDPYTVGSGGAVPTGMAYSSAHHRMYLGYASGAIRQIDVTAASPTETSFASMTGNVTSIGTAGNFVIAQVGNYSYDGGLIINSAGVTTGHGGYYYGYSRETAWDPVTSRVYFTRDGLSPNDLHFDVIDQTTGLVSSSGETPYHGSYLIQAPIRVSVDGQYVLLGSGDIYTRTALAWTGSLGSTVADARWFTDGSLVTLTTQGNQTTLRRLGATNLASLEQLSFTGQALRVVGTDARMAVLVTTNNNVQIHTYVPNDDSDGDGVLNTQDAFPLDRAASADSDVDGYPDAWNPGRTQADSTTGLTLDAFPQDSACWLSAHGSGGVCDYGATMPAYTPDQVVQHGDTIYLLSAANNRVYRWSITAGAYLNPYVVGLNQGLNTLAPTKMAYSGEHQRLYLGYSTGAIRYIAAGSPAEVPFANIAMAVNGLASVGNFVLAQDYSGAWATHYVINSSGVITDSAEWNHYSPDYAWDPVTSRVYYFSMWSPPDLNYEVIDQVTGQITSTGETPYHGTYNIQAPIRVSANGQYVLLGSGDLYSQSQLNWSGSLGGPVADARWLANGSLVTLTTSGSQTTLRRLGSSNLAVLEQLPIAGATLRVVGTDARMTVVVLDNGTVHFINYVPNDDSDGDGVLNTLDAFPLDRAASVDSDQDGYPDAWNPGRSQADSTTGLALDAFPQDAACWLGAHGSGGVCNYGATIPSYRPDEVEQHGDIIYLLSRDNRRVYRWSISTGAYLNPYVVGMNQGFTTVAPQTMEYSVAHQRLYLGYGNGAIRYINVNAGPAEVPFATLAASVEYMGSAGNFLVAQGGAYTYGGGRVLDINGVVTGSGGYYYGYSRETAWDPVTSRLYYMRDGLSPNDLHYDVINQSTGAVTSTGETPYHGHYNFYGVIRVSNDGQLILVGSGDFYSQSTLNWSGALASQVTDARWMANGSLVTLTSANNQTVLRRLGSTNLATLEQLQFTGEALRVVGTDASMVVLVVNNDAVQFHTYVPNDDSDNDGVTNTTDAFPLDRAASIDTDGDGYPDSWNPGRSQADSTTGLTLDAFPADSACWNPGHGSGGVCNYAATIPNYTPDRVEQNGDIIYLLSSANRRVYRWSMATGTYLNPYIVGINQGFSTVAPTTMVYSSGHQRLYLGYSTGAIRYIDVNAGAGEVAFTNMASAVASLGSAGNFLVVQAGGGYLINSSGITTDQGGYYYGYSQQAAWDPVASRLYYTRDGISPNDLHFDEIDQNTGLITGTGETPYHGEYSFAGPIRVSADGSQILMGSGDIYARNGLTRANTLGKAVADAHWKDNLIVDVDSTDLVEIRDANSRAVLRTYQYLGQPIRLMFGTSEAYLVHVTPGGATAFVRLPFYDQDGDQIARWWEQLYGLNDTNAADALTDLDSDGLNNRTEFLNLSNPTLTDTDADGLTDPQEINTYLTHPGKADTDGDGLGDGVEINTHQTDPLDTDSDDDGYSDLDEVLYGGDPNDSSDLPQPMFNYNQTFEGSPNLDAWTTPPLSSGPWALDSVLAHAGTASLKSGAIGSGQSSSVRFRGFFRPGQLSFWALVDPGACCNRMLVLIDGVQILYVYGIAQWTSYSVPITLGIHEIEFRYEKDSYGAQPADAARIDDVVFVGQ
jgi:hypothetical protein